MMVVTTNVRQRYALHSNISSPVAMETFEELMANVYCMVPIVWIWLIDELSVPRQSIYASLAYFHHFTSNKAYAVSPETFLCRFERDPSIQFTYIV